MRYVLFALTTVLLMANASAKPRVVIIGLDGILKRCLDFTKMPSFARVIEQGSHTLDARTTIQAVSAPGWSNILTGLESEASGILHNDWTHGKEQPITRLFEDLPSVFSVLKKHKPELKTAMSYTWHWFSELSNEFYPNTVDFEHKCVSEEVEEYIECEDNLMLPKFEEFVKNDVDLIFNYIGATDEAGHKWGFCSEKYIDRVKVADQQIGEMFKILEKYGVMEETTVIITTDHGASYMTKGHGDENNDNIMIPWMIMGPGIKKNHTLKSYVKNMDTTPTALHVFGLQSPKDVRARPVLEAFEEKLKQVTNLR